MRNIFFSIGVFLLPALAISQGVISYSEKGVSYIEHAVSKSEGLQAIATRYKVGYADVVNLNGFKKAVVLKEGQTLRIPIAQIIKPSCDGPDCVKVYYTVKASEGLYRIGVNFGNIKMSQLKALNNLANETVSIGQQIQVGFLPLSPGIIKTGVLDAPIVAPIENSKVAVIAPTVNNPVELADVKKAAVKDTLHMVSKIKTVSAPAFTEVKISVPSPANQPIAGPDLSKGFFATQFTKGDKELYGLAAAFKSESGWADNKFYILMNGVPPGTAVKIVLPAGGKYIFAKVLGVLPQVKENENVKFRLNNAGANALGVANQDTFSVTVQY